MQPLYSIGTWDTDKQAFTPQTKPAYNLTIGELRAAMRKLKQAGYSVHYRRDSDGSHYDNDLMVLIERTDGASPLSIRRHWRR